MARFRIEQRAPGDPMYGEVPWHALGVVEAASADQALNGFLQSNGWYTAASHHGMGTVHGVGHFRAMPETVEAEHRFMLQQQAEVAGDERHRVWTDVAIVEAADAVAALEAYIEHMRWEVLARHGAGAVIRGIGPIRAVPEDRADDFRVTPAPTGDSW